MKISVITINYNDCAGLKKTIESVLSQSYQNVEYIVIDGGSTDGSNAVLKESEKRISYCVSERDSGIYNAMNKGIKVATGDYLLFLNSGDWFYDDNVLEQCGSQLDGYDIVYGNTMNITKEGETWLENPPANISLYRLGYCWTSLPHQAMFFKKQLFDKFGLFNESLKMVADWEYYLLAIFKYNCSFKRIDTVVSYYNRDGFSSNLANEPLQKIEREKVIEQHFKNHVYSFKEIAQLHDTVYKYRSTKLIRVLKKLRLLKFY